MDGALLFSLIYERSQTVLKIVEELGIKLAYNNCYDEFNRLGNDIADILINNGFVNGSTYQLISCNCEQDSDLEFVLKAWEDAKFHQNLALVGMDIVEYILRKI